MTKDEWQKFTGTIDKYNSLTNQLKQKNAEKGKLEVNRDYLSYYGQGDSSRAKSDRESIENLSNEIKNLKEEIAKIDINKVKLELKSQTDDIKGIIDFLNEEKENKETSLGNPSDKGFVTTLLEKFISKYHEEEEKVTKLQEELLSKDGSLTDKQESLVKDIEDKLFSEFNLSEENKEKLSHLTGREKAGIAGLVALGISGGMQLHTQVTGKIHSDVNSLFSKWIKDPVSMLAMGNIIYKAAKDFEDGASASEIFGFIAQGSISLYSGAKFINSFLEAKQATLTNGKTFLETLRETYTTSNVLEPKYKYGYIFDTNTKELASTRFLSEDLSDIIASYSVDGTVPTLDGIRGRYTPLNGEEASKGVGSLDAPKLPNEALTPDVPKSKGKVLGAAGIAVDLAWLGSAIANVVDNKDDLKPSYIMDLVGSAIATAGDLIGLVGGPMGELVGLVVSGLGSVISAAGGLADLNSDSTPEEIANTTSNFLLTMTNPLLPSVETVKTAIKYQHLKDNADNEIDKAIYGAFHKIASLDATPLLNMTHGLYDQGIRNDLIKELKDKFGSFDNMMTKYIKEDTKFSENLGKVAGFLKNNAHTDHTQYITAYLAPEQIKEILGKEQDYNGEYDIRNVDTNLQVKGEPFGKDLSYGEVTAMQSNELEKIGAYELINKSGLEVLPPGANLIKDGDKLILDTISLGYGQGNKTIKDKDGNDISNPRVIDTATLVSYSASQLRTFRDKFRSEHTHNIYKPAQPQCTMVSGAAGVSYKVCTTQNQKTLDRVEVDEGFQNPKLWLNLVDDMSGIKAIESGSWGSTTLPSVNNRVITTVSDSLFPNINAGKGDDDVIINNVERIYSGSQSVLRAIADGGEGMDILDMSKVTEDLNGEYSISDSKLSFKRESKDGKDYDLEFSNFEQMNLGSESNKVTVTQNSDVNLGAGEKAEQVRVIGSPRTGIYEVKYKINQIDFSGVKSKSLYYIGDLEGDNKINGTENNDVFSIAPKLNQDIRIEYGSTEYYGMGGNDILIGGDFYTEASNRAYSFSKDNYVPHKNGLDGIRKNLIHGGTGNDFIKGKGDHNVLYGDEGNDFLVAANNFDVFVPVNILNGGADNDTLISNGEYSELHGDEGDDILISGDDFTTNVFDGGKGEDKIIGKVNVVKDKYIFSKDFGRDTITGYDSSDKIIFDNDSGITSLNDLDFILNNEDQYLVLSHEDDFVKIDNWNSNDKLNINIGGKDIDSATVENILKDSLTMNDYNKIIGSIGGDFNLSRETNAASPIPYSTSSVSYSTENKYSEVFSS